MQIPSHEKIYERLVAAEAKIVELEARLKEPVKPVKKAKAKKVTK